jgi:hypothetical protein
LLSNEFEHLDYKDLYENHSHQKKNKYKTGGYVNISFIPKVEKQMKLVRDHTMRKVWINRFICFSDFKYDSKNR